MATLEQMDKDAVLAKEDLLGLMASEDMVLAVTLIGGWWGQWLMRCGHKRLGRVLLAAANPKKEETSGTDEGTPHEDNGSS